MISRLTAIATTFAVLATASLAFATGSHPAAPTLASSAAIPVQVIQLERVVITGKRLAPEAR